MTRQELLHITQKPWELRQQQAADLDALLENAPYFAVGQLLRTRLMANESDILFSTRLTRTAVYAPTPELLHRFMTLQQTTENTLLQHERTQKPEQRESLTQLAEKMKLARQARRLARMQEEALAEKAKKTENIEISIENYKKNIKNHNYLTAIEILRQLNLDNSKKSVYFADQMRYLQLLAQNEAHKNAKIN